MHLETIGRPGKHQLTDIEGNIHTVVFHPHPSRIAAAVGWCVSDDVDQDVAEAFLTHPSYGQAEKGVKPTEPGGWEKTAAGTHESQPLNLTGEQREGLELPALSQDGLNEDGTPMPNASATADALDGKTKKELIQIAVDLNIPGLNVKDSNDAIKAAIRAHKE